MWAVGDREPYWLCKASHDIAHRLKRAQITADQPVTSLAGQIAWIEQHNDLFNPPRCNAQQIP
jgi:hypothetical protein